MKNSKMTKPHSKSEEGKDITNMVYDYSKKGTEKFNKFIKELEGKQVGKVKSTYKICENDFSTQPALNHNENLENSQIAKNEIFDRIKEEVLKELKFKILPSHYKIIDLSIQKTKEYYEKEIASLKRQIDMFDNLNVEQDEDFEQKKKEFLEWCNNQKDRYGTFALIKSRFNEVFKCLK